MRNRTAAPTRLAAVLLVLLLAAFQVPAAEEDGAGMCERAFWKCVNDPDLTLMGLGHSVYCLMGYGFCKKYVEGLVDPAAE